MTQRSFAAEAAGGQKQGRIVRWSCLAVVGLLVAGLWLQMPYLAVEQSRLEPWRILELWCADILALAWFVRFVFEHVLEAEPLAAMPFADTRAQMRGVATAGVAAVVVELLFTFSLMLNERDRYKYGTTTDATAVAVRQINRPATTWYEVDCRFKDASGQPRQAHVRVEAEHHVFPATLPAATAQVLSSHGRGTSLIAIRYDPQFPARAWADGAGWDDGQKIYWFSMLTLFFQAIVTALFLLLLRRWSGGFLPWWWEIYKVLPLLVGGFWLFVMGLIDRLLD